MKVRYQADADLNHVIVRATPRLEPGIDFRTAVDAELEGFPDEEVLARAAAEGHMLVMHDRRTTPRHFADFVASQESADVVVISQKLGAAAAAKDLALIWTATGAAARVNRIVALPL